MKSGLLFKYNASHTLVQRERSAFFSAFTYLFLSIFLFFIPVHKAISSATDKPEFDSWKIVFYEEDAPFFIGSAHGLLFFLTGGDGQSLNNKFLSATDPKTDRTVWSQPANGRNTMLGIGPNGWVAFKGAYYPPNDEDSCATLNLVNVLTGEEIDLLYQYKSYSDGKSALCFDPLSLRIEGNKFSGLMTGNRWYYCKDSDSLFCRTVPLAPRYAVGDFNNLSSVNMYASPLVVFRGEDTHQNHGISFNLASTKIPDLPVLTVFEDGINGRKFRVLYDRPAYNFKYDTLRYHYIWNDAETILFEEASNSSKQQKIIRRALSLKTGKVLWEKNLKNCESDTRETNLPDREHFLYNAIATAPVVVNSALPDQSCGKNDGYSISKLDPTTGDVVWMRSDIDLCKKYKCQVSVFGSKIFVSTEMNGTMSLSMKDGKTNWFDRQLQSHATRTFVFEDSVVFFRSLMKESNNLEKQTEFMGVKYK